MLLDRGYQFSLKPKLFDVLTLRIVLQLMHSVFGIAFCFFFIAISSFRKFFFMIFDLAPDNIQMIFGSSCGSFFLVDFDLRLSNSEISPLELLKLLIGLLIESGFVSVDVSCFKLSFSVLVARLLDLLLERLLELDRLLALTVIIQNIKIIVIFILS